MRKQIAKSILLIVVLLGCMTYLMIPAKAEVQSGEKDGIRWSYDTETKTLTFEGEGKIPARFDYFDVDSDEDYPPKMEWEYKYNDEIQHLVIKEGITEIGEGIFENLFSLETIEFCQSLEKIDERAFLGAGKISNLQLPSKLKSINSNAFADLSSIEEITIPDTVTYIGKYAFSGCKKLKKVNNFENVENISYSIFSMCESLQDVKLSPKLKTIPGGLFWGCKSLEHIVIPESATEICKEVFCETGLEKIVIPKNVKVIGKESASIDWDYGMFEDCPNLKTIVIQSKKIAEVGENTWRGLNQGVVVKVPKVKMRMYKRIFRQGQFPRKIKLLDISNPAEGSIVPVKEEVQAVDQTGKKNGIRWSYVAATRTLTFEGKGKIPEAYDYREFKAGEEYPVKMAWEEYKDKIDKIIIKERITEIGAGIFEEVKLLKSVKFPKSLKKIGERAFYFDIFLKEINLPKNLKVIGSSAFECCRELEEVTIPKSVTKIEEGAFCDCERLVKVTNFETVETISPDIFMYCKVLENVKLSPKLKMIPAGLFNGCTLLEKIKIPESVTSIGKEAFMKSGLKRITIPKNVKVLGKNSKAFTLDYGMFDSCPNLKTIVIKSDKITKVDKNTFKGLNKKAKVTVPAKKEKAYKKLFKKAKFPKQAKIVVKRKKEHDDRYIETYYELQFD